SPIPLAIHLGFRLCFQQLVLPRPLFDDQASRESNGDCISAKTTGTDPRRPIASLIVNFNISRVFMSASMDSSLSLACFLWKTPFAIPLDRALSRKDLRATLIANEVTASAWCARIILCVPFSSEPPTVRSVSLGRLLSPSRGPAWGCSTTGQSPNPPH